MAPHYPTDSQPATPDYVLAVLRDEHRQASRFDPEVDPTAVLSFDTTVEKWQDACNLLDWRKLGRAYNESWRIGCTDEEWKSVLEPASEKRLAGVCVLIAGRALRPVVAPLTILGRSSETAGAFLTIRSLLSDAGACAEEISPSASILPFSRRYSRVFLGEISRLAPGALPPVKVRTPVYDAGVWGMIAGWACGMIGFCGSMFAGGMIAIAFAGGLLFLLSYAFTWGVARHAIPASVEFGDLKTFRDLARVVADSERR